MQTTPATGGPAVGVSRVPYGGGAFSRWAGESPGGDFRPVTQPPLTRALYPSPSAPAPRPRKRSPRRPRPAFPSRHPTPRRREETRQSPSQRTIAGASRRHASNESGAGNEHRANIKPTRRPTPRWGPESPPPPQVVSCGGGGAPASDSSGRSCRNPSSGATTAADHTETNQAGRQQRQGQRLWHCCERRIGLEAHIRTGTERHAPDRRDRVWAGK